MKYYADLYLWSGEKTTIEIEPSYIDDIVSAVKGQYTFIDNLKKITIRGELVEHVDIYFKGDKDE